MGALLPDSATDAMFNYEGGVGGLLGTFPSLEAAMPLGESALRDLQAMHDGRAEDQEIKCRCGCGRKYQNASATVRCVSWILDHVEG